MKQFKYLFPLIAAVGLLVLVSNSPMVNDMTQNDSVENGIKYNPVLDF